MEIDACDVNKAMKHFMIAAGAGFDGSLKAIREYFMKGYVSNDDFAKALRAHKDSKDEMKSEQRYAAAAFLQRQRGENG